jgi:hypothetical protein
LSSTGIILALFLFKNNISSNAPQLSLDLFSLEFKVAYLLFLVSSIIIAFLKPKQEQYEAAEIKAETLEKHSNSPWPRSRGVAGSSNTLQRAS